MRTYRAESKRVNLDTERSNVLLLELSRQMALDEGSLPVRESQSDLDFRRRVLQGEVPVTLSSTAPIRLTFPVPPSPTRTSLKVGI